MKTIHLTTALLICIVVCIPSFSQADAASAKNADQFISVGGYNNSWILNKTTRKLIFVQFKKKDKLWKSEVVSIPADLNHSVLMPAGVKVNSVFLHDQSSGMTTFLTTKGDHSVEKYLDYNAGEDLKSEGNADQFISVGGYKNIWILNKTTRKLIFVQFKKKDKLWKSEVVSIPASYDLKHSVWIPAGAKVSSIFLHDQSSGMTTLFTVKGDHSVEKYLDYNAGEDLKLVYTPKTETRAKISSKLPLKLPLRKESNKIIYEYQVKKTVIRYDFYESRWNSQGSFSNDYMDNGDGTVTDKATGLMWEKHGSSRLKTWRRAKSYVKELNYNRFAGYSDWRLATIEELASLLERRRIDGWYVDPLFNKKQKRCWSSDKGPKFGGWTSTPPQVWYVSFREGTIDLQVVTPSDGEHRAFPSHIYVRAVRSIK
jgi:hypothetical protein